MKIRTGFVSNSSSASFVVALDKISSTDALKLMAYISEGKKVLGRLEDQYNDGWDIYPDYNRGIIRGFTCMDNGDLCEYLEKVGVNVDLFTFECD